MSRKQKIYARGEWKKWVRGVMVNEVRKYGILIVCLTLAFIVIGCIQQKGEMATPTPQPTETPTPSASLPDYDVEWNVGVSYLKTTSVSTPYAELSLKVIARHNFTDMYVIVSDPDGKTIGKKFIPKEDLFDGLEIVKFQIASPETTPKSGSYTVVLETYSSRELLYREKHQFKGPNIVLDLYYNVQGIMGKEMYHPIEIHYKNIGDLPLIYRVFEIKISKDSATLYKKSTTMFSKVILPHSAGGPQSYGYPIPYNTKNLQNGRYYISISIPYRIVGGGNEKVIIYGFDLLINEQGISTTLVKHYEI